MHQAPRVTADDREHKDRQEIPEILERTAPRGNKVNQASTVKMEHRVSRAQQDRKVPWDRRDLLDLRV